MIQLDCHCRSFSRQIDQARGIVEPAQGGRCGAAKRADVAAVVLVGDLPGAMIELQLLQGGERLVSLLDEGEAPLVRLRRRVETVVCGRRVTQERQRDEQHGAGCEHGAEDECDRGHARAGARRVTSRRCSRASGHKATADPSRKTMPATQSRFTRGLTSTFTYATCVTGFTSSAIT